MADILFFSGFLLLSVAVTFSLWVKVRVIRLRQDIFDERDKFFDTASALNACSDPAYRQARQHLNSLAHLAKDLSVPLLFGVFARLEEPTPLLKSENVQLQIAIDDLFEWSSKRIFSYLMKETFHGWIYAFSIGCDILKTELQPDSWPDESRVEDWVRSDAPIELDNLRRQSLRSKPIASAHC